MNLEAACLQISLAAGAGLFSNHLLKVCVVCGSTFTEGHVLATEKHCILYENSSAVVKKVICL